MDNKAQPRQSLADLALIYCGSAQDALDIALMNGMPIDADPVLWEQMHGALAMPPASDASTAQFFAIRSQPATGISAGAAQAGGINYMGIGTDFVVSGSGGICYMGIEIDFIIS